MKDVNELCDLIKQNPPIMVNLNWAEETDNFSIQRMHDIIIELNDINLINAVIQLIVTEWELLVSQDDPRCYTLTENCMNELKFPDRTDYSNGPHFNSYPNVSIKSITGVLYLCKQEALRTIVPLLKYNKIRTQLLEELSKTPESNLRDTYKKQDLPVPVVLKFFDSNMYVTAEEQHQLRLVLQSEINNIDTTNGREWLAFYVAYRYVKGLKAAKFSYVDFFMDIENLLPEVLTMLKRDKKGDKRYKHYTLQLSKEIDKWYVDNGKLPALNSLVYADYRFQCSEDMFMKLEIVIRRLFQKINELENKIKEEKRFQ